MTLDMFGAVVTRAETERLDALERVIEQGLQTFVDVGMALREIRDNRLYRATHDTFENYCQERWGWARRYAYYMIDAATAAQNVHNCAQIPSPANEAQARPLTRLEPDQQREAWREAVETAPDGKVTGAYVERVVERVIERHRDATQYSDVERKTPKLEAQFDVNIRRGDFREVLTDIPDASVKIILTDPPYGKKYLDLWDDLGAFAARVLRPDGMLATYSGQLYLPQVIASLSRHLDWWWLCGLIHKGSGNLTPLGYPPRKVINQFKPVLIFVPHGGGVSVVFRDLLAGHGKEKDMHNWQQPTSEAYEILEAFCEKGDLVVDPFAGSGAFGEAARELGLPFIGAEILGDGD